MAPKMVPKSQTQTRSDRLEIRIDPVFKEQLREIARMHGVTLTDLVINALNIVAIREFIEQYETIEKTEKTLVRMIVERPAFQEMLRMLKNYVYYIDECYEWDCQKQTTLDVITGMGYMYVTLEEKNGMLMPAFWIEDGYDNEYGSHHYYSWHKKPVETLQELAEWLEAVKLEFEKLIRNKLNEIKEALERLSNL